MIVTHLVYLYIIMAYIYANMTYIYDRTHGYMSYNDR